MLFRSKTFIWNCLIIFHPNLKPNFINQWIITVRVNFYWIIIIFFLEKYTLNFVNMLWSKMKLIRIKILKREERESLRKIKIVWPHYIISLKYFVVTLCFPRINSYLASLVWMDFESEQCGRCHILLPILEKPGFVSIPIYSYVLFYLVFS